MTAVELARELEVSERTVTRDAQALSEAGIPVYAEKGRGGGYRLIGGYRTRLTGLGREEAEALFLSGVPGALREMGLEDVASAARMKVSAALIPALRDAPVVAAQRFHLDAPGWFREAEVPEALAGVARGVWGDRRVRGVYRKKGSAVERELDPYGLVLKAGVWYLCARVEETFRVYRVERFESVEVLDEGFERDPDFELPAFWEAQGELFARSLLREEVVVRLSPEGVRMLPHTVDPIAARQALAETGRTREWTTVTLGVESQDVAFTQLLALGAEAEVVAPAELRERFVGVAGRLGALYAGAGEGPPSSAGPLIEPPSTAHPSLPADPATPGASGPAKHDAGAVMDETEFWELIDRARDGAEGDPEEQADLLVARLLERDPESVLDFSRHFESRYNRAYRWDLWGAAWVLLDGVSDDAFDSFRCWLIGQGRDVFEGALHDPDSLADLLGDFDEEIDGDGEELGFAADEAYEGLTGVVAPDLDIPPAPPEPEGTPIDFENEKLVAERYPRLWERFKE